MTYQRPLSVEDFARKLKPLFGKKIDELYFRYVTAESLEEKNEITQLLTGLYQKNLSQLLEKGVLLEPPREGLVSGEYDLGKVEYSKKIVGNFGLREKDWPRHMCITGMSGSGKTTFAFNILQSFIQKDKPFLVFDWKKSFRPLMAEDNSIMCFTVGNNKVSNSFKTNINRPPKGVAPKEWINNLCDLLTESFSASFGVHKILLETLDETYEKWGVYSGSDLYPNWQHIKKVLESKMGDSKGRETGWYESAMRIATVLTFGDFGKVVNYDGKKSLSVEDLFNKRVIFELNSLSNIEKKFFCEYILTYIYKLKKAGVNKITNDFNYSILVDEAHNIFLKDSTNFLGESVTDMVYREMREYGTSLICLDQHISKLSDTVKGNSACHVAFQQQLPQDTEDISSIMQLREKKEMFSQLELGNAIVKLSERHTRPFLIQAPFVDLRNISVTDEKITSRMDALISGIEIEKYDTDFENKLHYTEVDNKFVETLPIYTQTEKPEMKEISTEKTELQEVEVVEDLSKGQEVLYEFAKEKLKENMPLNEIEALLDAGLRSGYYSSKDVLIVMNKAMKQEFESRKEKAPKQEIQIKEKPSELSREELEEKINAPIAKVVEIRPEETISKLGKKIDLNDLTKEEVIFVKYLGENPAHEKSTVELYKEMKLSTRKGNIVKTNLMKKGFLDIEEKKNDRGWKKLIKLSNSYSI